MFEFILFAIAWVALAVIIMRVDQKMKQVDSMLDTAKEVQAESHNVMTQAGVMVATGNQLNKQREAQIKILNEVQGAHVEALEEERKMWTANRKDYEAAITKQTRERKKKIRGKKRRGK